MSDPNLLARVYGLVDADADLDAHAGVLVIAALEDTLAETLGDPGAEAGPPPAPTDVAVPPAFYLTRIDAAGFRGVGPKRSLNLRPGPGLTVVAGRNGSGKSSLAEAAEVALTGTSVRWAGRTAVWQEGFRNLHHPDPCAVEVELAVDGQKQRTVVGRAWSEDAGVDAHTPTGDDPDWSAALSTFRPFLSYSELGKLVEGQPKDMHDAMQALLGLGDVVDAVERLSETRLATDRRVTDLRRSVKALVTDLGQSSDDRAPLAAAALKARPKDLDALEALLSDGTPPADGQAGLLANLAAVVLPTQEDVAAAAAERAAAATGLTAATVAEADAARLVADLLRGALDVHAALGDGPCPVCQAGVLDAGWRAAADAEVARLDALSATLTAARARDVTASRRLAELAVPAPPWLDDVTAVDATALAAAWTFRNTTDLPAGEVPDAHAALLVALADARTAVDAEVTRRRDEWRPLATRLHAVLADARATDPAAAYLPAVKAAEEWLKTTRQALQAERLAPIAEEAQRVWQMLRQGSNVVLGPVTLEGEKTRRRVTLDVTVDDVAGAALGVMSQGELHALGLSLFLPRATADLSPFRFLVVDDPVQAMDPSKVDGLARLLHETARTRQVVVFTHDDRLPEALRRLDLPATVWEVSRRENSAVGLRMSDDPVRRHLTDADALAHTDEMDVGIRQKVVAGFCRAAVEAAAVERVRRTRIDAGEPHALVDEAVDRCTSTTMFVALALLGDHTKGAKVYATLNAQGAWAGEVFRWCRENVHPGGTTTDDLVDRVHQTRRLVAWLRK